MDHTAIADQCLFYNYSIRHKHNCGFRVHVHFREGLFVEFPQELVRMDTKNKNVCDDYPLLVNNFFLYVIIRFTNTT